MAPKRENRMRTHDVCLKLLWMVVGILIVGGIYCLSYYDVDEAVVSESKTFMEFVRTVLK